MLFFIFQNKETLHTERKLFLRWLIPPRREIRCVNHPKIKHWRALFFRSTVNPDSLVTWERKIGHDIPREVWPKQGHWLSPESGASLLSISPRDPQPTMMTVSDIFDIVTPFSVFIRWQLERGKSAWTPPGTKGDTGIRICSWGDSPGMLGTETDRTGWNWCWNAWNDFSRI